MRVLIIATVTRMRDGEWRSAAQIPQFVLDEMTSLRRAVDVARRILDPHSEALSVSIGAVEEGSANYLGATFTRDSKSGEAVAKYEE